MVMLASPRGDGDSTSGDAESADEVGERRDVVERVVDEREGDAVEEGSTDERGFREVPPLQRPIPRRRPIHGVRLCIISASPVGAARRRAIRASGW